MLADIVVCAPLRPTLVVRDTTEDDLSAITAIYAHHVLHGTASFELTPPSAADMQARRLDIAQQGLPYLAAVIDEVVVGFAYATRYRPRPAYRHTVEDSIYVAPGQAGKGIGGHLLRAVIERCTAGGWRQMLAVVGDSANAGSLAVHARCGFVPVGTLRSVGFKHGEWRDTILMQRSLGDGDRAPPA